MLFPVVCVALLKTMAATATNARRPRSPEGAHVPRSAVTVGRLSGAVEGSP